MGKSVNKVILLGNVGKEVETRTTTGGTLVANFSLATSERHKDQQGEYQDRTEWHNLVAFARTAEIIRDYAKKGSKLYIEGKLQTRNWDDKDTGKKIYRTEIVVNEVSLLDGVRGESNGQSNSSSYGGGNSNSRQSQDESWANAEISDDDIPF